MEKYIFGENLKWNWQFRLGCLKGYQDLDPPLAHQKAVNREIKKCKKAIKEIERIQNKMR